MVTFVKGSPCFNHVRVAKFIDYFDQNNIKNDFWCWRRSKAEPYSVAESYLLTGGGYASRRLIFYYPIWCFIVFLKAIIKKYSGNDSFFVIDFDSALPIYLASIFRRNIIYVYDIHDDFSMRYNFPKYINKLISKIDSKVKRNALKVIHVDQNRVREGDFNYEIIYNTPVDIYSDYKMERPPLNNKKFAVTGLLSMSRGLHSIYQFAKAHPHYNFVVAGNFQVPESFKTDFLKLSNVKYLGTVDQNTLFLNICDSGFIFSLYDPSVEINRRAASNKLYDAMMLGIPVVTNFGLIASDLVEVKGIGFVVNYDYDDSWSILSENKIDKMLTFSDNSRQLYELEFSYDRNFTDKLSKIYD